MSILDIHDLHSPMLAGSYSFPFDGDDVPLNNVQSVVVQGDFAYCGDGSFLWVFDVRDPADIRRLGYTDIPEGEITGLALSGSVALAAALWGGFQVIELADPVHPKVLGAVQGLGGWPQSVMVAGPRAAVAMDRGQVLFFDISKPSAPRRIGEYITASTLGVQLAGGFCFVAGGESGLEVVDLVPANPSVSSVPATDAGGLAVRGSLAVLVKEGLIQTFEVTQGGGVKPIGSLWGGIGSSREVAIGEGFACYLNEYGDFHDGGNFRTVDLGDPAHPQRMGSYEALNWIVDYVLSGSYAYLVVTDQGLRILDLSNPSQPALVGSWPAMAAVGVGADNGLVCLAEGESGVSIVDAMDATHLSAVGRYSDGARYHQVLVSGVLCYAADTTGRLQVLDLSQPAHPRLLGGYNSSIYAAKLLLAGRYLYLWGSDQRLEVLNVSDPARIWRVGGNSMANHWDADVALDQGRVWMSGFGSDGVALLSPVSNILPDPVPEGRANRFGLRLYGAPGASLAVERSQDLKSWTPWLTLTLGDVPLRISEQAADAVRPSAFFRVRNEHP